MIQRRRIRLLIAGACAALLCGCAPPAAMPAVLRASPAALQVAATNQPPGALVDVGADRVQMLHGGTATFRRLVALVDAARTTVHAEMYEFSRPDMRDALERAQRRGVAVVLIVDPSVPETAAMATTLRAAGIDVIAYPVRTAMIDHVKLLVVDSRTAVVGGINWGIGSERNHDVDAVMTGPVASNLERVFDVDLVACGRLVGIPDAVPDPAIDVATTLPGADIRPLIDAAITASQRTLDIELFVVTDTGIVADIIAAYRRGVAVRVLLDPSQSSSDTSAAALVAAGVPLRHFRSSGEKLHAKLLVADGSLAIFGSANWSAGGFSRNHECDVRINDSPAIAADIERAIDADWSAA